jgi:uncharacterized protein (DUF1800 family)
MPVPVRRIRRQVIVGCCAAVILLGMAGALKADEAGGNAASPVLTELTERQRIVHLLGRIGFGARPGDVERVRQMGMSEYLQQQLRPSSIDDSAAESAVAHLDTLQMSSKALTEAYFADIRRFLMKQAADGANMEEMKLRYGVDPSRMKKPATRPAEPNLHQIAELCSVRCVGEIQQAKLIRAVMSERQLQEVMVDFWSNHFNVDIRKDLARPLMMAHDREVIRPRALGRFRDLLGAVSHSPAMLVYLDNQENSVDRKISGLERKLIEWYVSSKLGLDVGGMIPDREGPNENYARELLELHALGVDGGYTQKDVQEVARCFSGWGLSPFSGKFDFNRGKHDNGVKTVLGVNIPAGAGSKDGELVLDLLAKHPAAAKFISRKLCQRLVADEPPAALVERTAKVFAETDGDIAKAVESIVTSPEFHSPAAFRAKVKSPFEYAVSAVRATDGRLSAAGIPLFGKIRSVREGAGTLGFEGDKLSKARAKSLNWHVHDMGQPLFAHAAPTGYPEQSSKWVGPGALIGRLNFAIALTSAGVTDVTVDPARLTGSSVAGSAEEMVDRLAMSLLNGDLSAGTRATVLKTAAPDGKGLDVAKAAALIIGSPEFQRR